MKALEELPSPVSIAATCRSVGLPRATLYWRRRRTMPSMVPQPESATTPRSKPARALSEQEQQEVLDVLHSEPFADKAPAEVYAALLDQGRYPRRCPTDTRDKDT